MTAEPPQRSRSGDQGTFCGGVVGTTGDLGQVHLKRWATRNRLCPSEMNCESRLEGRITGM